MTKPPSFLWGDEILMHRQAEFHEGDAFATVLQENRVPCHRAAAHAPNPKAKAQMAKSAKPRMRWTPGDELKMQWQQPRS